MSRPIVSVLVGASFFALATSGLYAFFFGYHSINIFLHVLFGWLFLGGVFFHLRHNLKSIFKYLKRKHTWAIPILVLLVVALAITSFSPVMRAKSWYESFKSKSPSEVPEEYAIYDLASEDANLELEILAGDHFWFPQIAVWIEDTAGNYLETVLVTYSTSQGVFYGDRTKENFKELDKGIPEAGKRIIRVDALPYWSHKRGVKYQDGLYAPHPEAPLPDGISGATPQGNFKLKASYDSLNTFKVLMEVNVAFDDNEYFSEFDFPYDSLFHSGAGLLGQPSLIYETTVESSKKYTLMETVGHGHHSGQTGELYEDLSRITTAKEILERVIVKYGSLQLN
ncbi:MAG: hypothetical protein AAGE93_22210 [Bacteroidota bacterium]